MTESEYYWNTKWLKGDFSEYHQKNFFLLNKFFFVLTTLKYLFKLLFIVLLISSDSKRCFSTFYPLLYSVHIVQQAFHVDWKIQIIFPVPIILNYNLSFSWKTTFQEKRMEFDRLPISKVLTRNLVIETTVATTKKPVFNYKYYMNFLGWDFVVKLMQEIVWLAG